MAPILQVSKQAQFNRLASRDRLTVVLYFAEWCHFCRIFDPIFERIASCQQFGETLQFCSIDCTEESKELDHLQGRAKVEGFPHVGVFRGGKLFCKRSGFCEYGSLKTWLMDCLVSHSISRSPGKSLHSQETMQRLHNADGGKRPLVMAISSFEEIDPIASEKTYLVVAFYKESRTFTCASLWSAWETSASKPEFEAVQFVSYDCENNEELAEDFFLHYQSRCWFFRRGTMFSEWKSACTRLTCQAWLVDCLRASKVADSTNTDEAQSNPSNGSDEIVDEEDKANEISLEAGIEEAGIEEAEEEAESTEGEESCVTYVSGEGQWQELLSETKNVVLSFYDVTDPFSQAMLVVLESVASSSNSDSVKFCAIDCSEEAAELLAVKSCLDIRIYSQQREICRTSSPMARDEFTKWIDEYITPNSGDGLEGNRENHMALKTSQDATDVITGVYDSGRGARTETNAKDDKAQPILRQTETPILPVTTVSEDATSASVASPPQLRENSGNEADERITQILPMETLVVSPTAKITSTPTSASSDGILFDKASLRFQKDNHSTATLTSISSSMTYTLPPCTGDHQDRPKPRLRWLGKRQPFHDPEPGCVFVPTEDGQGLQIGRANEGDSYFNITLSQSHDDHEKDKVTFGVGFGPDPTMKTRFLSAVFRVTFGYNDDQGRRTYLKIRDLSPKDEHGETTEVHWGKGSDSSVSLSVGYSAVSLGGETKRSKNADYTRKTSSRVRGHGVHTPSAEWTFQEDEGEAGQHGLDPQYQMSVTLPHVATTRLIWMEFWGKAVLARGRSFTGMDVTLKIGSAEETYKRNLDLSSGVSTAL